LAVRQQIALQFVEFPKEINEYRLAAM